MSRNASLASRIRPSRSHMRTPTMLESTNRLTPAPNKADAFICSSSSAARGVRSDALRLRYQAPRRKRQREAEDLRRQNTVRRPDSATPASSNSRSMTHTARGCKYSGLASEGEARHRRRALLAHNLAWRFVIAQRNELGVPEVVLACPFEELDLRDQHGLQPPAVFHLRCGQARTPSAALRLWEIHERAILALQPAELLEQLFPHDRRESVSSACGVDQTVALVVSEDERIERLRPHRVAANH